MRVDGEMGRRAVLVLIAVALAELGFVSGDRSKSRYRYNLHIFPTTVFTLSFHAQFSLTFEAAWWRGQAGGGQQAAVQRPAGHHHNPSEGGVEGSSAQDPLDHLCPPTQL